VKWHEIFHVVNPNPPFRLSYRHRINPFGWVSGWRHVMNTNEHQSCLPSDRWYRSQNPDSVTCVICLVRLWYNRTYRVQGLFVFRELESCLRSLVGLLGCCLDPWKGLCLRRTQTQSRRRLISISEVVIVTSITVNIYRNLRTQQMSVLVLLCTFYTTCFGPYCWSSSGGL
jgi:hypothetical protein